MTPRFPVLLLLLVPLAGCMGNNDSNGPAAIHLDGERLRCDGSCPRFEREGDAWVLDVGRLHGSGPVGLLVTNPPPVLVIRGAEIQGYQTGIEVRDSCPTCILSIEDSSINAIHQGIMAETGQAATLQNIKVITPGGGQLIRKVEDEGGLFEKTHFFQLNGTSGITLTGNGTIVEADGLIINAEKLSAGAGLGIRDSEPTRTSLRNITIKGYDIGSFILHGLHFDAAIEENERSLVTASRINIACGRNGINDLAYNLKLNDITIDGCTGMAIDSSARHLEMREINITGSYIAINSGPSAHVLTLTSFLLRNNGYGLQLYGEGANRLVGTIKQGVVENNLYVGLETGWRQTEIENVQFKGNGHGWPDPDATYEMDRGGMASRYGGMVSFDPEPYWNYNEPLPESERITTVARVSESVFIENLPYAISHLSENPMDARGNYWDSPYGPNVYVGDAVPPLGLGKQTVSGPVIFEPFNS